MSEKTIEVFFDDKVNSYWIEMSFLHFIQNYYGKENFTYFNINSFDDKHNFDKFVEMSIIQNDNTFHWYKANVITKINDSVYLLKRLDNEDINYVSTNNMRIMHHINKENKLDNIIIDKIERISENEYKYIKDEINERILNCYDKEKEILYLLTFENKEKAQFLISFIKEIIEINRKEYNIVNHYNEEITKQKTVLSELQNIHNSKAKYELTFSLQYKSQIEDYLSINNYSYSLKSMNESSFTLIIYLNSSAIPKIEIVELNKINEKIFLLSKNELNELITKSNIYLTNTNEDTLLIIGEGKDIKLFRKLLYVQLSYKEKINSIESENKELNKTLNRIKLNYKIK